MLKKNTNIKSAFNEYTVIEQCGQGGNCTVFKVKNNQDEIFALKILPKSSNKDKTARFQNEIDFCYKNSHPNIVRVMDFGCYIDSSKTEFVFCIMPFYPKTLRDRIKIGLSSDDCVKIFCNILCGLKFAHEKGVFHRDIKPENILLNNSGSDAVISDFGIAHFKEDDLVADVKTKMADKLANANYAAPEQRIKGAKTDGRCDIFALSLILNEMFTRQLAIGANHRKIKLIDKDYDYLDDLFDRMNTQAPEDRLFPVDKILLELSVLTKLKANEEQLRILRETQIQSEMENKCYPTPKVIDAKYQNQTLFLEIEPGVPTGWSAIFKSGYYDHASLMNYGPERFKIGSPSKTQTFEINCQENNIVGIVKHFKEWLPIVSEKFNTKIKTEREQEIREQERARQNEISRIEHENKANQVLKDLI